MGAHNSTITVENCLAEDKAKGTRGGQIGGPRAKAHDEESVVVATAAFFAWAVGGASGRGIPGLKPIFVGGDFSLD